MSVVGDLRRARDIVAKGWCKGRLEDGRGNVCVMGALNIACTGSVEGFNHRRNAAARALIEHIPKKYEEVAAYNDHPSITHEDILNLFDKTLADLGGLGDRVSA